ncbi:MAG: hypothetical protein KDE09_23730 [Anaerolineales bacterium]|nr:hypothetical protein [Anaerolineales bacterium]
MSLTGQAQTLLLLLAYSLAFLLMLTLAAKKYDRYALPALLPLLLLAASGWVWLGARWPRFRGLPDSFAALVAAGQFLFLLVVLPFPLAAYNWLGGGVRVAERVMTVGWGEAVSTAAADLGQGLPAGVSLPTLFTDNVAAAAPFYPGPVARLTANNLRFARNGDSIVVEGASWQGGLPELLASREADQYWQLRGLTARRYPIVAVSSLPRQLVGWSFGAVARVTQVEFDGVAWPERIPLALTISLDQPADYQLQLALQDSNGHVWASWEQSLLNEFDQTGAFWIEDIPYRRRYDLAFPGDLPPGSYTLTASLFADGARLGVFDGAGQFAGVSLPLATLPISAPTATFSPAVPQPVADGAYPGLAGFGMLPAVLDNGGSLSLDIWWTAAEPAGQLALLVGDTTVTTAFAPPTIPPGATYHLRPRWELPLELAAGEQPLALQLLDEAGSLLWAEPYPLGTVEARQRPRTFDLPAGLDPLNLQFGELALLQSATAQLEGDKVIVELVWQARGPLDRDYFHFVHLRGPDGQIVSQSDRLPAEPTSLWVTGQVIVDRVELDRPVAGDYTIAIGLYDPETGQRPPLFDSRGAPLSADQTDQYLLPLTVP